MADNKQQKGADGATVSFDFSVKKLSNTIVKAIFWLTFALFVLSTPTQWLTQYRGWEYGDKIAEWTYNTFGAKPTEIFSAPWTIITHMFMHGGLLHFGMNMLMLFMFYKSAREFFPSKSWLVVYFGAGIAGCLAFATLNQDVKTVMVGASGGLMGLWGAAIAARLRYRYVPEDERPWQCDMTLTKLLAYLSLQFATEFLIANIAHSAHAGGLLAGLAIGALLPLAQQPRLVASRKGLTMKSALFVGTGGSTMASSVEMELPADFDPKTDFVAVEYDQVDFRGRRSVR